MNRDEIELDPAPTTRQDNSAVIPHRGGFRLSYRLLGSGWLTAVISSDRYWAELRASYLSDAIRALLHAVAALTTGAGASRCSWVVEPGEYRWLFDQANDGVHLLILGFRDAEDPEPDGAGTFVFQTVVPLIELATWIVRSAERAHRDTERPFEDYEDQWGYPFPQDSVDALNRYIASQPH